jgi:hypothetical protein
MSGGFIGPFTLNGYESLTTPARALIVIPKEALRRARAGGFHLPWMVTRHLL